MDKYSEFLKYSQKIYFSENNVIRAQIQLEREKHEKNQKEREKEREKIEKEREKIEKEREKNSTSNSSKKIVQKKPSYQ